MMAMIAAACDQSGHSNAATINAYFQRLPRPVTGLAATPGRRSSVRRDTLDSDGAGIFDHSIDVTDFSQFAVNLFVSARGWVNSWTDLESEIDSCPVASAALAQYVEPGQRFLELLRSVPEQRPDVVEWLRGYAPPESATPAPPSTPPPPQSRLVRGGDLGQTMLMLGGDGGLGSTGRPRQGSQLSSVVDLSGQTPFQRFHRNAATSLQLSSLYAHRTKVFLACCAAAGGLVCAALFGLPQVPAGADRLDFGQGVELSTIDFGFLVGVGVGALAFGAGTGL